ncbi:hypothetical protein [Thalassobaculum litoreum]|uniref:Type II and III secretion system protein n=1 Tax=Thalassobaculum litoreum DSM 18839 TaxID=1123362 RepID=A0A8G2BND1_9PROT|nr:hypothetical protein [Thalassobaculum litoreum]SDG53676.1 type II and III secretion system protein [Thalassobaculum litoreum DSM 18839]
MKRGPLFLTSIAILSGCAPQWQQSPSAPLKPAFLKSSPAIDIASTKPIQDGASTPTEIASPSPVETPAPAASSVTPIVPTPPAPASAEVEPELHALDPHEPARVPEEPPSASAQNVLMKGASASNTVDLEEYAFELRSSHGSNDPLPDDAIPQPFGAIAADPLTLLRELAKQRGFSVAAGKNVQARAISLHLDSMPVSKAVEAITRAADLSYSYRGNQLTVSTTRAYTLSLPPITARSLSEDNIYENRDEPFYNQVAETITGYGGIDVHQDVSGRLISFSAGPRAAEAIRDYARELRTRRVRITYDIWIAEVSDTNSESRGIRWDQLTASIGALDLGFSGGSALSDAYAITTSFVANGINISNVATFLESQGDVEVVSNPHVAMISGSSVRLDDTTTNPYLALQPIAPTADSDASVSVTTGVDTRELTTGVVLSLSGDYQDGLVTTSLSLSLSDLLGFEEFQVGDAAARLPRSTERTITTQITTPPGATVVLGGISRSSKSRQRDAVPLLGDVLPFLFSSKNKSAERKQIVIALVPHIVRFKNENDT